MILTRELNKLVSGILWLFQFVNLYADQILDFLIKNHEAIPIRYKAIAGVAVAGLQFLIAIKAHKVNPDGSPAQVAWRPKDKK